MLTQIKTQLLLSYCLILLNPHFVFAQEFIANNTAFNDATGSITTFNKHGDIDLNNPFFQSLGSNDRSCGTCHKPENGWSISPPEIQQHFKSTQGTEAIFRTNDGANSPLAKVDTLAQRSKAYSSLLNKGVFRIALKMPINSEFELTAVSDPYGFIKTSDINSDFEFSLFRRPLPATNLKFISAVMWDGRESINTNSITEALSNQANNATIGHAQGLPLTTKQQHDIVAFESGLFTGQLIDKQAGKLTALHAKGGSIQLAKQTFYTGINDFLGDSQTGSLNNPKVFTLYDSWNALILTKPSDIKAAIARGQLLFNSKPITITGVAGVNNAPEFGNANSITGTCSTCHNIPNVGSHSIPVFVNLGISDEAQRSADLPLYTLKNKITGELIKSTDLGRALITGQWQDMNRFKIPVLRGLAARAPYFHNGMAAQLGNVVDFYDRRFSIGFDNRERLDLILFLQSL